MSNDERERRKQQRMAEVRTRKEKLPWARIDHILYDSGVTLELEEGKFPILVNARGEWLQGDVKSWTQMWIDPEDVGLEQLATFIRALVARYNWIVEETNRGAAQVAPLAVLEPLSVGPDEKVMTV